MPKTQVLFLIKMINLQNLQKLPGQDSRRRDDTELFPPIITLQPLDPNPITLLNGILYVSKVLIKSLYTFSAFAELGFDLSKTLCNCQNVLSIFLELSSKNLIKTIILEKEIFFKTNTNITLLQHMTFLLDLYQLIHPS